MNIKTEIWPTATPFDPKIIFSIFLNDSKTVSKEFTVAKCNLLAVQTLILTRSYNQRLRGYESRYPSNQQGKKA